MVGPKHMLAAVVIGACLAGAAAAQEKAADKPAEKAVAMTAGDVVQRPQVWPDVVTLKRDMSDGSHVIKAGTALKLYNLESGGVIVEAPGSADLTMFPIDATDLVAKANEAAAALPEAARQITLRELMNEPGMLPPTVKLTEEINFGGTVRKAGKEIGPYKLMLGGPGVQIIAIDPDLAKEGKINNRQLYALEQTDFRKALRERLMVKDAPSRLLEELKGRLVDASGKPVDPKPAKYYAIYSTAAWCGWCARFDPELIKFYDAAKAKGQEVEVIYLSQDKSESEMLEHMTKSGIKYPAVKFEDRYATPFMLGLVSGATPHLVVVTADGHMIHDGNPAGMNGAQAALRALQQELARTSKRS